MVKIQSLLCVPVKLVGQHMTELAKHFAKAGFLNVLGICYNERKEYEALVLFILPITLEITATVLILLKMFNCIRPLILFLEKDKIPCA